jgi:hypothetical protein
MLDHRHRCIFIHQRKAAGTSIIAAFGFVPTDENWHRYNDGPLGKDWRKRDADVRSYFVFSVVRNPFDRAISGWRYLAELQNRTLQDVLENPPRSGHAYRHFTRLQVELLEDPATGQLVTEALIRYERLQLDFDDVRSRLGMEALTLTARKFNPHRKRDYRDYFNPQTRRLAAQLFGPDIEAFGYEF